MVYYVFFCSKDTVILDEKFNNENDFIEYYINKRIQCLKGKAENDIEFDIMPITGKVPMFFKKKMLTVYFNEKTTVTYYVMKLPTFCSKFFEKIFSSFIKL